MLFLVLQYPTDGTIDESCGGRFALVVADSPVHSSSSDDFAEFLDTELDSTSDTSPEPQHDDDEENYKSDDNERIKRRKVEVIENTVEVIEDTVDSRGSTSHEKSGKTLDKSLKSNICAHPGIIGGLGIRCGQKVDDQSGVAFDYIHKDLRLANDEIARLRNKDLKNLFRHKKLY